MSYDARLLFAQICVLLDQSPARSLVEISQISQATTKTIRDVVASMAGGVKFSSFKDDILIARLTRLFSARPAAPIKKLALELGYKSSRTFVRAVRRACGVSPAEVHKRIAAEVEKQMPFSTGKSAATAH